ncbi:MAG: class I poly(R)-hydroxyalkanoic acid synthase [Rhizobiales bacterium]|nr:class I poly(R)-hydroxyalkanoic acid synthase [Hyphomicrobiales bacterium]
MTDQKRNEDTPSVVEDYARNLFRLMEESGKVFSELSAAQDNKDSKQSLASDEMNMVAQTLGTVAERWMDDPKKAIESQTKLMSGYADLWGNTMRRMMGEETPETAQPNSDDKRFRDEEWTSNQYFDFVKQAYLLTSNWAENVVEETENVDENTKRKAAFYVTQIINALSPSNFVPTNPELVRETMATRGDNLVRGMKMLGEDIHRGKGSLKIRQSDYDAFEVGGNLATTPGKVVFQNDLIQLIQYEATTEKVLKRPLLIVPPWINKFYILDLTEKKSFIKWCVAQGHTVFVVSWINPDSTIADKTFEDYMREGIIEACNAVETITGEKSLNAIGYCVGGTLLTTTLAHMANGRKKPIKSATLFTTQIDFTHAGDLMVFVDEEQIQAVEKEMAAEGYLDSKHMATAFNMLRANDLIWPYMVNVYGKGESPFPFDLLYWNSDSTRMPATNHSFYLREYYLNNNLTTGRMEMGGKKLDLGKVTIPIYNLATKEDHIAPAKSAYHGSRYLGGDVKYVLAGSGHIAGVINSPNKPKYQYWTGKPPVEGTLEDWMETATETPGSWWPNWQEWIVSQDSKMVDAREIGGGGLKPIEDAPGSYVKMKS